MIDAIAEKLELDTRRVTLEFDERQRGRSREDRARVSSRPRRQPRHERRPRGHRSRRAAPGARPRQSGRWAMRVMDALNGCATDIGGSRQVARALALSLLVVTFAAACARTVAPPVVTTPRYPDYIVPDAVRRPIHGRRISSRAMMPRGAGSRRAISSRAETGISGGPQALAAVLSERNGAGLSRARAQELRGAGARAFRSRAAGERRLRAGARRAAARRCWRSRASPRRWRPSSRRVKVDPQLQTIARRVEVLRARAQQENVAAARRAAQANRLDEAARLYEQAIAASPDSAFLVRDLADVEAKQGKTDEALARYRRVIEMDPTDAISQNPHRRDARRARRCRRRA